MLNKLIILLALIMASVSVLYFTIVTAKPTITAQRFEKMKRAKLINLYYKDKEIGEVWCDITALNYGDGFIITPTNRIVSQSGICM